MPGPLGTFTNDPQCDAETMCCGRTPTPGPMCVATRGANSTDISILRQEVEQGRT
jgi:hypothetical protein